MNLARLLLRIDARRPASWLTLFAAAGAVWLLAAGPATAASIVAAWLTGAALAVAAIGGPLPSPAWGIVGAPVWVSHRLAWPAIGAVIGAIAAGIVASIAPTMADAVARGGGGMLATLAGMVATANVVGVVRRRGGNAADAASFALLLAGAAALAVWLAMRNRGDGALALLCLIVAAWGVLAAVVLLIDRQRDQAGDAPGKMLAPAGNVLSGSLRRWLYRAGMAAALGGMVGWLFLVPEDARLDVWLSVGCFVALAAPAALLDSVHHAPAWRRLLRSAASTNPAGRLRRLAWGSDPNVVVPSTWMHAAVLGWPPLVAALLSAGAPRRAMMALGVTAAVAAAALVLRLLEAAARSSRVGPDFLFAGALVLAIAAALAAAGILPLPRATAGTGAIWQVPGMALPVGAARLTGSDW